MAEAEPIRDKQKIVILKKLLKAQNPRDFALFTVGINSGLRISDLLLLQFQDVREENGNFKKEIRIKEQKTKKYKTFPFGKTTQKALSEYFKTLDFKEDIKPTDPLFFSREKKSGAKKAITRQRAFQILKEGAIEAGIEERIATHSLRKTFGYHAYKKGTDLTLLMDIFNHSSQAITLQYIGITKEEKDSVYFDSEL